ncbi:MAG: hypothetical protein JSW10_02475 [Pseudomonadota bacterium]|nr:MAG: hypothetical protein JSW10_02475 [Pseudomonadota bacterium]
MDPYPFELLSEGYGAFVCSKRASDLSCSISRQADNTFVVELQGNPPQTAPDSYELIYAFEKGITIELQKIRRDLLFLHSAALEYDGQACLLVAAAGSGKSTTTWALLHHGFRYLSDELAPIDLRTRDVHPYPHALCLKADPPTPFDLPEKVIRTAHTIHVPVSQMPAEVCRRPAHLAAVFFVRYDPAATRPMVAPISRAEAGARIYSNALNLLAHERYGLDAAVTVANNSESFELVSADLIQTSELMKSVMQEIPGAS